MCLNHHLIKENDNDTKKVKEVFNTYNINYSEYKALVNDVFNSDIQLNYDKKNNLNKS